MKYTALHPIKGAGGRVEPGEQIELTELEASALLAVGAVEPVARHAKATTPHAKAEAKDD